MTNRPYPLRIPEGILQLAELRGHEERTDKTTAVRQWLYAAAEEYAFKRLAEGRLTLSPTAELLDLSVYDVQQKARERGIELGATAEQYRREGCGPVCPRVETSSGLTTASHISYI